MARAPMGPSSHALPPYHCYAQITITRFYYSVPVPVPVSSVVYFREQEVGAFLVNTPEDSATFARHHNRAIGLAATSWQSRVTRPGQTRVKVQRHASRSIC